MQLTGIRVCVVSNEPVGRRMTGPPLRAVSLARQLQERGASVTLATPVRPDDDVGVPTEVFGSPSARTFHRLGAGADVVVTQPQRVDVAAGLHRAGCRVVYDLYVPAYAEYPQSLAHLPAGRQRAKLVERNQREYATAVACAAGILAASPRQATFWLGALGQAGRLADPPQVAVVPFGIPDEPGSPAAEPVLRGTLVPDDALIALWTGGLWRWLDPATTIAAFLRASDLEPRLRLVIMASGHPSATDASAMVDDTWRSVAGAADALRDGRIVLATSWVPADDRWTYLTEADVAVCAHRDNLETELSFRTRFLDHLWAGLPTVTTVGGSLADLMVERAAAIGVPAEDVSSYADALVRVARDADLRARMSSAAADLGEQFRWSRVAEPLANLVASLATSTSTPVRPSPSAVGRYLAVAVENRLR